MSKITEQVGSEAQRLGIEMIDVKIRSADLPEANSQAIYQRMQTERQRQATEIRAAGRAGGTAHPCRGRPPGDGHRRRGQRRVGAAARRGRGQGQRDLRQGLQQGSGVLRLLPVDAGLPGRPEVLRHAAAAVAEFRVLPVFRQFVRGRVSPAGQQAAPSRASRRRPASRGRRRGAVLGPGIRCRSAAGGRAGLFAATRDRRASNDGASHDRPVAGRHAFVSKGDRIPVAFRP